MKVTKATKAETEAQLETRARLALLNALPWLDGKEIKQQVSFTVRFGHAVIHVDGKEREHVTGRADILVTADGVTTLVLELKRPELGINDDGRGTGTLLRPHPPSQTATGAGDGRHGEPFGRDAHRNGLAPRVPG
mgnify:CR=1 FL=1